MALIETYTKNISSKDSMRVECQKCKCKKVSLQREGRECCWDSIDLYLVCNHCGHKVLLYCYYPDPS